MFYLAIWLQFQ